MADSPACSAGGRVVALLPDTAAKASMLQELSSDGLECVPVGSAYEAAAELISAPVLALVIDLRLFGPRHLRLLQIARQLSVELLAVGGIPIGLSAEDLNGVRLLARSEVQGALARLAGAAVEYEESAGPQPAEQDPSPDRTEQYVSDAGPVRSGKKPAMPATQAPDPGSLLSAEELSALLENEP
ncbi:MAG TPA: hypothetical protein VNA25_11390 [Phycisphaerae bacterium]|nr:hypothetical protein [Phycisphaerae bacterium]